ncbi:hypothetical protein RIF29_15625 [Crotalaria pallida]|uniref:Uncharacterized protein n=1 Tax=Crotalaria pallida TaxID=3830 RepID=A0AAN9FDU1_CROPI
MVMAEIENDVVVFGDDIVAVRSSSNCLADRETENSEKENPSPNCLIPTAPTGLRITNQQRWCFTVSHMSGDDDLR